MINEEIFELIGLTKNDGKICIVLLSEGEQRINEIEKKTQLHRRTINDCLSRLQKRGYVAQIIKNNKKYWRITDVRNITSEIKEKIKEAEDIVPKLLKAKAGEEPVQISIFTGEDVAKLMLEDQLKIKSPTYTICSMEFEKYFWDYLEKRLHKRMFFGEPAYLIYPETERELSKNSKKYKSINVKFVPKKYSPSIGFEICGDNLYLQKPRYIIKIKNRDIANALKEYFNLLWEISKS